MTEETTAATGTNPEAPAAAAYADGDFVYVHPDERRVVGRVEWTKTGNAKPLAMPQDEVVVEEEQKPTKGKGRGAPRRRKRYFPWGTYKSMKAIYKLEGKAKRDEPRRTLDEAIEKAVAEPFWD